MKWLYKSSGDIDSSIVAGFSRAMSILLRERGVSDKKEVKQYLNPTFADINDPFLLPNMRKAVDRIVKAIDNKEKVVVYGDYDADGVTATSILWDFLYRQLGLEVIPFIPSRFEEGYGLNKNALENIQASGTNVVITVDCGVKDKQLIEQFDGLDFIVTDHHTLPGDCDFTHTVVHPALPNSKYPYKNISGAVVAWKLVHAIAMLLNNERGMELDFKKYIDLAAIGTVCDVMPLENENRVIVKLGLEQMPRTKNLGLEKLLEVTSLGTRKLTSFDIGFIIGPRINAAGRLGSALEAVRLFTTHSENTATKQAVLLNELNAQRQQITVKIEQEAYSSIEGKIDSKKLLFAYGQDWSEGIVGLVAGRLLEKYKKPAICATVIDGKVIGSARSIKNFNITQLIAEHSDLLLRFGGHELAAGFTLLEENLGVFKEALEAKAASVLSDDDIDPALNIDIVLPLKDVDMELAECLESLEPYGFGNPTPIFEIDNLIVKKKFYIGKENQHLKLYLENQGQIIEAICFNYGVELDKVQVNDRIDVAAYIKINSWKENKNLQLVLQDFR